jgi:hypothetical protein
MYTFESLTSTLSRWMTLSISLYNLLSYMLRHACSRDLLSRRWEALGGTQRCHMAGIVSRVAGCGWHVVCGVWQVGDAKRQMMANIMTSIDMVV